MLKYNKKTEVTQQQYDKIMLGPLAGSCAGRVEEDKYFIKYLVPGCGKYIKIILNN
jgi:hypothetical protein